VTARDAIAQAGGLHSIADLADRWGMTPQWVRQLVRRDGFPAPVLTAGGRELWLGDEADDAFIARYQARVPTRPRS
jgi:hypothetical protein